MKTKNFFKALAFALLITTACNRIEVSVKKGYELPVTINATRQGDNPATRATYNGSTKKLEFSSGDKLLVRGYYIGGGYPRKFAGTLTWVSEGTFSGTITTETQWTGTADALLSAGSAIATLLPNGYESYGFLTITDEDTYSADVSSNYANAFATSKATGVEQLSYEYSDSFSSGFALAPQSAILNFTINGLTACTEYAVVVSDGSDDRGGNVTTNGSGTATFAVGVSGGTESDNITLTVGGTPVTLNLFGGTNTEFVAGHVYNVTRSAAPVAKAAAEATAEDKGKLIGTDGKIYADVAAATAAGTTAVAKIIYIGTTGHATYTHGLALALTDEGQMTWEAAKTACNTTKNTSTPVTGATWLLASKDQWDYMKGTNGAGSYTALRDGFSGITGASNLKSDKYWSSTEDGENVAYYYFFYNGLWLTNSKSTTAIYARACLAF